MMSASFYQNEIVVSSSQSLDSWRVEDMTHYLTPAHKEMIMSHPNQTFIFEFFQNNRYKRVYDSRYKRSPKRISRLCTYAL